MPLAAQETRTYFLTFVAKDRWMIFRERATAELMVATMQHYRVSGKYLLHSFVLMPDHVHVLLTPAPDVSLEKAIQFIRGGFSFRLKSRHEVWDRGYYDRRIKDGEAFDACRTYIEENPVRGRLAKEASEWPYSSAAPGGAVDPKPPWF